MAKRQLTAAAGKKLGRYVIERELGRGGMGVVYLALDENLGRRVALKTTSVAGSGNASRNQRRARFVREVRALAQVSHPNVVHVFDAGEADDPDLGWLLHYSMEYVEGITLAQLVHRQGALSPDSAAAVCMQVAAGLGAAHRQGIIHRDVKPANIFLTTDARALIGDFGICKIEGSTQITRRDQLVGTPNYLAPEQILGDDISPATDVFALGALFYVIATNSPMRSRVDAAGLLQAAQTNESRDKALALAHFPDGLRKVLAKSLERDPADRYPSCREFADALSEFASRIPPLDDAAPKTEPTQDNMMLSAASGAFASIVSPAADAGIAAAAMGGTPSVEEMARALLDQVGDGDEKDAQKSPKIVLPVGKSESTVMFNLRQMEDEENAKAAEVEARVDAPLPVARTESTMMFNIRQMEDDEGKSLADAPPATDTPPSPVQTPRTAPPPSVGAKAVTSSIGGDTPLNPAEAPPKNAADEQEGFDGLDAIDAPADGPPPLAAKPPAPIVTNVIAATHGMHPDATAPVDANPMGGRMIVAALSAMGGGFAALLLLVILGAAFGGSPNDEIVLIPVGKTAEVAPKDFALDFPAICDSTTKNKSGRDASVASTKRAMEALEKNRYAEAEKQAQRAVSLNPGNQAAHYAVMEIFFKKGGRDVESVRDNIVCAYLLDKRSEMGADAKRRLDQLQAGR